MRIIEKGDLVIFSESIYADHEILVVGYAEKAFSMKEACRVFRTCNNGKYRGMFLDWLVNNGLIKEVEYHDIDWVDGNEIENFQKGDEYGSSTV